jgi:hypothetical protein
MHLVTLNPRRRTLVARRWQRRGVRSPSPARSNAAMASGGDSVNNSVL